MILLRIEGVLRLSMPFVRDKRLRLLISYQELDKFFQALTFQVLLSSFHR